MAHSSGASCTWLQMGEVGYCFQVFEIPVPKRPYSSQPATSDFFSIV
jgi:hypothetical protein